MSTIRICYALILAIFAQAAVGQPTPVYGKSAARVPGLSYRTYFEHVRLLNSQGQTQPSAMDVAVSFNKARLPAATAWESEQQMIKWFLNLRDIRFLFERQERMDFARRSSWLYPDDGCFARAQLASYNLRSWSAPAPSKIFVFGDLTVHTRNAPEGSVSWWYHVAPIVQIEGEKYVLDPALEPQHPLKLVDWLSKMSPDPQSLQVAICGAGAYIPTNPCATQNATEYDTQAHEDQLGYLAVEWDRVLELKRNPERELGEFPPWVTQPNFKH